VTAISLGLVLASEEPEADVMQRPPRRQAKGLIGKLVAWRAVFIGLLLIVAMLGQQQWTLSQGHSTARGHTMALNTLVVGQCMYVLNCRFFSESSLSWRAVSGNVVLTTMIVLTGALQCLITYTPGVQRVFTTEGIDGVEWLRVLAFATAVFLIVEAEKYFKPARWVVPPARRAGAAVAAWAASWLPTRRPGPAAAAAATGV
jgi:magnesium-transporting ATPase (P-type)